MIMRNLVRGLGVGFAAILCVASATFAQTAPSLGAAQSFAVLSGTASLTEGTSVMNGDVGTSGVAGIVPGGTVNGTVHDNDALADQAQLDAITAPGSALNNLLGQVCSDSAGATIIGVATIGPGVHCYTSSLGLTGTLTLDGGNDPDAVFIFKIGTSLDTTGAGTRVLLIRGAQACNVFWAVGSSATLDTSSTFVGNILSTLDISVAATSHLYGRALAGRAITLTSDIVDATVCAAVGGGVGACVAGVGAPIITTIPSQVIPVLPVGGSVAVGFTISGAIITDALMVSATSSDTTLVPASAMVITKGVGGARVLTIFGADGRAGETTITVTVTDPVSLCQTTTTFLLTIGTAVPTLPQWAMIVLTVLLALAGFVAMRRRVT
jgi:hypothetical protein